MISCVPLAVTPLNYIACWERSQLLYDTRRISASPFTRDSTCINRIVFEDARRCRTPVKGFRFSYSTRDSVCIHLYRLSKALFSCVPLAVAPTDPVAVGNARRRHAICRRISV